jgi:hypothetical protein
VGKNRGPIPLRGRLIAKLRSRLASEIDADKATNRRILDRPVSELKRDRIGDAKEGRDVCFKKGIEGVEVMLDERETCVFKIGLKHVAGDVHCLQSSNHFRTDDEASACGVKHVALTASTALSGIAR